MVALLLYQVMIGLGSPVEEQENFTDSSSTVVTKDEFKAVIVGGTKAEKDKETKK